MNLNTLKLIIISTFKSLLRRRQNLILMGIILCFGFVSLCISCFTFKEKSDNMNHYKKEVRYQWEHRPDKHPHRMAHYGNIAMRNSYPLVVFDKGIDDYFGNIIFLEAHIQNSAYLSEASSSGSLVRFGVFSPAFILQIIVPLVIFFLGFNLVSEEKEHATLKILKLQGASARDIIFGKTIGLWSYFLIFLFCFLLVILGFSVVFSSLGYDTFLHLLLRIIVIFFGYIIFYFVISSIAIVVSAMSKGAAQSLVFLIGLWLLFSVFIPKITEFSAQNIYPTPSRIAFDTKIQDKVLKVGDSHNPNDPHFKRLKDSILRKYQVDTIAKLPINYSGVVMYEGEKITSRIYKKDLLELQNLYLKQLSVSEVSSFFNPITAIKNVSMEFSGTDYYSYQDFQNQAQDYRYYLTQRMNKLIVNHLSNIKPKYKEKPLSISHRYWKETKDFNYQYLSFFQVLKHSWLSVFSLVFWLVISVILLNFTAKKLKFV